MGNIALNKQATATNSILPYVPSRAVDGNLSASNRWVSGQVPTAMTVNPGASYLVNRWVVKHPALITTPAGWSAPAYVNSDYKLQGSNDQANWFDIDGVVGNTLSSTDRTFAPVAFRYFRIYVSKGLQINNQTTSILEFELYQAYSAALTNLTISAGALSPAFNTATLSYTATVNPDVASINVTPTALSPAAVIKVNNVTVASGNAAPVALSVGSNTITVNVTDGTVTQNYVITVTRIGSLLSSLTVQSGTGVNIPLTPTFASGTQAYTASVVNNIGKVTFTPTAQKSTTTITIKSDVVSNGVVSKAFDVEVGSNAIPIVVTADGASYTYTVTITRASAGVNLLLDHVLFNYSGRGITPGSVNKTMIDAQTDYPITVLTGSTAVTVSPTARDASVTIKVNNAPVPSGGTSVSIPLNSSGTTTVTIVTSSPDGSSSRTYTFTISKGAI